MDWVKGDITGVVCQILTEHGDERGRLYELFRTDEQGLPRPAMGYCSWTWSGVLRGPHEHRDQTDVFVFTPGFIVFLWDSRRGSPTYRHRQRIDVLEYPTRVIVPPGVVHAYRCAMGSGFCGQVWNFPDRLYGGWNKREEIDEIRHEQDPDTPYVPW